MNDVFRKEYSPLNDDQKEHITAIKEQAQKLHDLFDSHSETRELSIAKEELETSVMWAVKSISGGAYGKPMPE